MLEKIKNDPELIEFDKQSKIKKTNIKKTIDKIREKSNNDIAELRNQQKELTEERNRIISKLYRRHYVKKNPRESECVKLFGKQKKELNKQELRDYNKIMAQKRRNGLSTVVGEFRND